MAVDTELDSIIQLFEQPGEVVACEDEGCDLEAQWVIPCPRPGCANVLQMCDYHTMKMRDFFMQANHAQCKKCRTIFVPGSVIIAGIHHL